MIQAKKTLGQCLKTCLGPVAEQAVSDRRRKAGTDVPPKKRMDGWNRCPTQKKTDGTDVPRKVGMDLLMLQRTTLESWNGLAWFRMNGYGKVLTRGLANYTLVAPSPKTRSTRQGDPLLPFLLKTYKGKPWKAHARAHKTSPTTRSGAGCHPRSRCFAHWIVLRRHVLEDSDTDGLVCFKSIHQRSQSTSVSL